MNGSHFISPAYQNYHIFKNHTTDWATTKFKNEANSKSWTAESRELSNKYHLKLNNWSSNIRKIRKLGEGYLFWIRDKLLNIKIKHVKCNM